MISFPRRSILRIITIVSIIIFSTSMATQKTNKTEEVSLTPEQLARLKEQSGAGATGGIRLPVVDQISLNGNCDAYEDENAKLVRPPVSYRKMLLKKAREEKEKTGVDARVEKEDIGAPIEVIFLRSRAKLIQKDKEGRAILSTTQYGHKDQVVKLWQEGKCIATDKASSLRERFPDLRTVQQIYALYKGELVIVVVKGSAFGSEVRDEAKHPGFFKFMGMLSSAGKDTGGICANTVILNGIKEKGKLKEYYTMTFDIGRATTNAEKLLALEHSDELTALMKEYDAENSVSKEKNEPSVNDSVPDGAEELSFEDVPF